MLLKLVPDNTNIDWLRWRHWATVLSLIMVVGSIVLLGTRGLNLGIDIIGGQNIRVAFAQPIEIDQLRNRITALGHGEPTIQQFGSTRDIAVRMPVPGGAEDTTAKVLNCSGCPQLNTVRRTTRR